MYMMFIRFMSVLNGLNGTDLHNLLARDLEASKGFISFEVW